MLRNNDLIIIFVSKLYEYMMSNEANVKYKGK